ncbi:cytochrome P450, partial [Cylindrobasidium torrendii FP15055 ss-10]
RLIVSDTKAIAHILQDVTNYKKPPSLQYHLTRMVGSGVLVVEGEQHRKQRRIMNPAFGNLYVKELSPVFMEKSLELRDIWAQECASRSDGIYRTDAVTWLSKLTLDIIGRAGFNYDFHAMEPHAEHDELQEAFSTIFGAGSAVFRILQGHVPLLRLVPTQAQRAITKAKKTMNDIAGRLLAEAKQIQSATGEKLWDARDMLSLLVRSNTSPEVPENQRMSDEEVMSQIPTFFVAGHETTATALAWMLFALTRAPHVQQKLRNELLSVPTSTPSFDELNALPYLDAVVRETLRLHSPVTTTSRISTQDDILPLSKPITDRKGNVHDSIAVGKGTQISIPILAMNVDPEIWGEDADEFKPERWENLPTAVSSLPGVWGNMMSFLGGARACIGYRFSLAETKAIVFTLVRAFEFELAVRHEDIISRSYVVQRPYLASDLDTAQLPVIIRPVSGS